MLLALCPGLGPCLEPESLNPEIIQSVWIQSPIFHLPPFLYSHRESGRKDHKSVLWHNRVILAHKSSDFMAKKNTGLLISIMLLYLRVESIFSESLDISTCLLKASGREFLGFTETISIIQALCPFSGENTVMRSEQNSSIFFSSFSLKFKIDLP